MAVIYKATNTINGKSYIGFTSRSFEQRMKEHKHYFKDGKTKFYKAISKYGWDAFTWEVLQEEANTLDEQYYIEKYNSVKDGYNLKSSGELITYSEESRQKMSESAKNKKISDGFRDKCRQRMVGNTISPGGKPKRYNVIHPDGSIEKIENLKAFCKVMGLNPTHMSSVSKGKRTHHRGYKVEGI